MPYNSKFTIRVVLRKIRARTRPADTFTLPAGIMKSINHSGRDVLANLIGPALSALNLACCCVRVCSCVFVCLCGAENSARCVGVSESIRACGGTTHITIYKLTSREYDMDNIYTFTSKNRRAFGNIGGLMQRVLFYCWSRIHIHFELAYKRIIGAASSPLFISHTSSVTKTAQTRIKHLGLCAWVCFFLLHVFNYTLKTPSSRQLGCRIIYACVWCAFIIEKCECIYVY